MHSFCLGKHFFGDDGLLQINFESMLQLRNELQFINLISNFNIAKNL